MHDSTGQDETRAFSAMLLRVEGVVLDTAGAEFAVWKDILGAVFERHGAGEPLGHGDHADHVDGRPAREAARRVLASRGIELPEEAEGAEWPDSLAGIAREKTRRVRARLEQDGVSAFDDALALVESVRAQGIAVAAISDDGHGRAALDRAGVTGLFDAIVEGGPDEEAPPSPAAVAGPLRQALDRLGTAAQDALLIDTSLAGLAEGARARFGFVVGLARQAGGGAGRRHALRAAGADLVTPDLGRLVLPDGTGLRTLDRLPSLWDRLEEFEAEVAGRPLLVFLDFDGTLAPIVDDHREAALPAGMAEEIATLAHRCPTAIISGRDLEDVRARVGVAEAIYAGSHGFDIAGPGGLAERPEGAQHFIALLDTVEADVRTRLAAVGGSEVERKLFSVAVHYRNVAEGDVGRVEDAVDAATADRPELRKGRGRKVLEIQPRAEWDKGSAVAWLLDEARTGEARCLPLYVGDDLTDEDAFSVLVGRGIALAVRGADRPTLADYALDSPDDVRRFLRRLASDGKPGGQGGGA